MIYFRPDRLEYERSKRKWTQGVVAEKIGVARPTYANYESGKREPDFKTLRLLADLFEVDTDYLLGQSDFPKGTPDWATPKDVKDAKDFLEQQGVMYDGVPMNEENKAKVLGFMEAMFWEAREENKKKGK